jgi:hypothetical protein
MIFTRRVAVRRTSSWLRAASEYQADARRHRHVGARHADHIAQLIEETGIIRTLGQFGTVPTRDEGDQSLRGLARTLCHPLQIRAELKVVNSRAVMPGCT